MLGESAQPGEQYSDSPSRAFFEKIPSDNWEIVSYDSKTRNVCVRITDNSGVKTMGITLPTLSLSSP